MSANPSTETIRADDFVEYFLFPDTSANGENAEEFLNTFLNDVSNSIKSFVENYIWHKDAFRLIARWGNSNLLNENVSENDGEFCGISQKPNSIQIPFHFHR